MTAGGWFAAPADGWADTRVALVAAGVEFTTSMAATDLRWWSDRVRMNRAKRIPGYRTLAAAWQWKPWKTRQFMADEAGWMDPRQIRAVAAQTPRTAPAVSTQSDATGSALSGDSRAPAAQTPRKAPAVAATRAEIHTSQAQTQAQKTSLSNSATAESDPDTLTKTWEALQAIRKRHQPAARGQSLSTARRRNLRARLSELRKAGHDRGTLLHAGAWVFTSSNMHAEGARKTGDPIGTLLRAKHCLKYVELSIDGSAGPAVTVANGGDTAWQHIVTMTSRGDLAERIRSGRLGPDPAEHGRRLAAIKAAGGFPAFRMMGPFTERKIREAFQAAYAGGAA